MKSDQNFTLGHLNTKSLWTYKRFRLSEKNIRNRFIIFHNSFVKRSSIWLNCKNIMQLSGALIWLLFKASACSQSYRSGADCDGLSSRDPTILLEESCKREFGSACVFHLDLFEIYNGNPNFRRLVVEVDGFNYYPGVVSLYWKESWLNQQLTQWRMSTSKAPCACSSFNLTSGGAGGDATVP